MIFKCVRCGKCCENLGENGLDLRDIETKLFPKEYIIKNDYGDNIMYKSPCPNYKKGEGCLIYKKRPLICQLYPIFLFGDFDEECNGVRNKENKKYTKKIY